MTGTGGGVAPTSLSAETVVLLQSIRGYPAVSLLLSTTARPVMTTADALALRRLLAQAGHRLRGEELEDVDELLAALQTHVAAATAAATSQAIAIYARSGFAMTVRLPTPVHDRVVVDPTFATRDLVSALHQTPRHVVLLLSSREARLFEGVADTLRPAPRSPFPLRNERERGPDPSRPRLEETDTAAFLTSVDRALGTHLRLHPAPLVLAGAEQAVAAFTRLSQNLSRLAGTVPALATTPLPELVERIRPVLTRYLRSRQREALDLLDRRAGGQRVVSGMSSAWLAARHERPEMLAVEHGLFYPARLSGDGDLLLPAWDVEHPDVIDDAVDELIELVLDRGGWVALVDDGALAEHEGVALTLRAGH
ncbi:hypothetical protein DQ238_07940 [Geodermatophilus sp. TF02-6]|uniref:baeRF3 domain-containing protein n=1 Tax=Geodermatophilus sp. TF02-6 TaxID=2250575 RepID=UPI000DE84405|nr:hypothetical protein [Geodermatophilus sp. TF02-6]RBY80955.1 hypothetical protein DQ238_07940 [Geodermatophilus sp. TF02-6]